MHRHTAVASIIAATLALGACGVNSPDAGAARATQHAPQLLVDLQSLPDGHPPVPGFSSPPTLPEGHPPVPGFQSRPALPEGHPRCPARDALATPPSDAGMDQALHSPPELIST
jgi:hypothetical protein